MSEPVPAGGSADVLNAPLGAQEIKQILEMITLFASTATAVVAFANKLLELMRQFEVKAVPVRDSRNGRQLGTISETDTPEQIVEILNKR